MKDEAEENMKRTRIRADLQAIPEVFHTMIKDAPVYDSSCSPEARVLFIDKDGGYYLKSAPKGTLETEARMTAYFHGKGLAAEVLAYESGERDWMMTARVPGEDCTHGMYLAQPERLCDLLAERLRMLHELDAAGCPSADRMEVYRSTVERNCHTGEYDKSQFPDSFGFSSAEEAWAVVRRDGHLLRADTLIHGDYCLPNVMLDDWRFSGFSDVGNGGVADRHIDLFWGVWTLGFNLKTDRYASRFLDAYGRDRVETELLRVVAACEVFG